MKHYKRSFWRELWLNRPWVYLPAVVLWMINFPYRKHSDYFSDWIADAFRLNWEVYHYYD